MSEEEPHLSKKEARAGSTPFMTRPILVISMILVIVIFVILVWSWSS